MKINWKIVAQSEGYKSLKAELIKDITKRHTCRSKETYYKEFRRIIGLATHYAHHHSKCVGEVLTEWEANRTCWWYGNYSSTTRYNKIIISILQPMRKAGLIKYYMDNNYGARFTITRVQKLQEEQRKKRGKKLRWSNKKKAAAKCLWEL